MHSIKLLFVTALLLPSVSHAAFSGLHLSHSPEIPQPEKPVVVTASVIDRQESSLEFIWRIDGVVVADAVGQTTLELVAPKVGAVAEVVVEVRDGGRIYGTERLIFRPSSIFLEWEGVSSVPPFYIGKRHVAPQGSAAVSAIPHFVSDNGTLIASKDILYEWRVNGAQKVKLSQGKSSYVSDMSLLSKPQLVTVVATTKDGSLRAQESVVIPVLNPEMVIYEFTPLSGILDHRAVMKTHAFTETELTLAAYPIYTRSSSVADVTFSWELNGNTIETGAESSRTVTFRKTAEGSGSYDVSVSYVGVQRFLERAAQSFLLQF